MWKMLQQKKPNDYVIATGKTFTIKEFVNRAAKKLVLRLNGLAKVLMRRLLILKTKKYYRIKKVFQTSEVDYLKGNAIKAKKLLKWFPKISINNLIDEMIEYELENLE